MSKEPHLDRIPLGAELDRPDLSVIRRLLKHVRLDTKTGCWEWTRYRSRKGYGQIKIGGAEGRAYWAHRVAFACFWGNVPAGYDVDHACNNTRCVNPDHLRLLDRPTNTGAGNVSRHEEEVPF